MYWSPPGGTATRLKRKRGRGLYHPGKKKLKVKTFADKSRTHPYPPPKRGRLSQEGIEEE